MNQSPRRRTPIDRPGNRRRGLAITGVAAGCAACCAAPAASALTAVGLTLSMLIYPALLLLAAGTALMLMRWRRHRQGTTPARPDQTAKGATASRDWKDDSARGTVELTVFPDLNAERVFRRERCRDDRLTGVDEIVLSLYAKGLTTGEISAHFAQVYGAPVSRETISRLTDKAIEEMQAWQARPFDGVYAAIFLDAIVVKVRDGQVANRPVRMRRHASSLSDRRSSASS